LRVAVEPAEAVVVGVQEVIAQTRELAVEALRLSLLLALLLEQHTQ